MPPSSFAKTRSLSIVGTTLISLSLFSVPATQAAIIGVSDAGSWATGSNTLSNLGFNMVSVPNSPQAEFGDVSALNSPLGNLSFSRSVNKRVVPTSWISWSHGYTGEVYFTQAISDPTPFSTLTITLPAGIGAFDFYAQPNLFGVYSISAAASNGSIITQSINGVGGAQYFGFYSDDPSEFLTSIIISAQPQANGFAIGELRLANPIPTPALLPGLIGLGLGIWRKRKGR
ncbi:PTPA-CTERM sorting domain-containing protein [Kovacikia minuta CCNUW1]|uniref:PTPA-CTERM sorting domain-containing protein n=1 Tax=Kovacikia minuta TaxID=2931930 RepID=UPI001CCD3502|nr:PTPA-CTERM sorting domain-containing protein [Kovacikia minuta]UBF28498.1 PTPA-CTERM sorting domain-containing protein [Kovacikia minuta CCNUW1]